MWMMTKTSNSVFRHLLICFIVAGYASCRKSDDRPQYPAGTQENINSWILDSMRVYYYWNSTLPGRPNVSQEPTAFFTSIKNGADRFSALVNPDLPATYPPSLVHTLGFDLITLQTYTGTVQTVISLVVPGSRADNEGLLRGDIITTFNGEAPTSVNIKMLIENAIRSATAELEIERKPGVFTIGRLTRSEDPVYIYKTFAAGGKIIGYLFLNSFEPAALERTATALAYFKTQQVQELIIDLRYNPGGSVPVAAAIATMLAPNAAAANTFVEYRGNANAGSRKSSFATELNLLPGDIRRGFNDLTAYRNGLNKVFFLTGSHTASAAELLINCLRPYMTVVQVGSQTIGKDMATFLIKDYRNPQVVPKWEIYPMIFKLYNAAGGGDYGGGLAPDKNVDELTLLPLVPFGDGNDPLVRYCIGGGSTIASNRKLQSVTDAPAVLYDSRDKIDISVIPMNVSRR
jgi:carboxyl-terminal processing protease